MYILYMFTFLDFLLYIYKYTQIAYYKKGNDERKKYKIYLQIYTTCVLFH